MDPLLIVYLIGYIWFWRYHVGFTMHDLGPSYPDGTDWFFTTAIGSLVCIIYPLTVSARAIQVVWRKTVGDSQGIPSFFPAPKEIETRDQKRKRLAREAEQKHHEAKEQIKKSRAEINRHERENGLKLTVWNP